MKKNDLKDKPRECHRCKGCYNIIWGSGVYCDGICKDLSREYKTPEENQEAGETRHMISLYKKWLKSREEFYKLPRDNSGAVFVQPEFYLELMRFLINLEKEIR